MRRLPSVLAWLNGLIPLVAVVGAYSIALHQQAAPACNPLIDGCTSISRAARSGDAIFLFRGLMMPLSMLLVLYWLLQWHWLNQLIGPRRRHTVALWLGIISALALVLYTNYLGTGGGFYEFMRRTGIIFHFAFALLAQLICVQSLFSARNRLPSDIITPVRWQFALVSIQWLWGAVSLAVDITLPAFEYEAKNVIEWNFAWAMVGFYGVSGWIWWRHPPQP
ncbi:hypothetical protein OOT55_05250 [Marinimicrobium sp. C6131]|uniref:hypothetical protein n=1 Tax=Marinimicrobium sp. C6131 TaxID=3022676 RepID=UPI00223D334D|nr:hypothetical protein [Marinimicrobium sp. C6131]UZJ45462.1 hypothetical protein OOT55_05250 [Marinimicrobium sp. C6131]